MDGGGPAVENLAAGTSRHLASSEPHEDEQSNRLHSEYNCGQNVHQRSDGKTGVELLREEVTAYVSQDKEFHITHYERPVAQRSTARDKCHGAKNDDETPDDADIVDVAHGPIERRAISV